MSVFSELIFEKCQVFEYGNIFKCYGLGVKMCELLAFQDDTRCAMITTMTRAFFSIGNMWTKMRPQIR